jgi:hypothetical protein
MHMRPLPLTFATAALFLSLSVALQAQDGHRHEGFWIGFGIGGGSVKIQDSGQDALGGAAAYVRLGGTLGQRWLLGGEAIGWGRSENGVSYTRSNTTVTAMFYPSQNTGFYLKGGLGFSFVNVSTDALGPDLSYSRGGGGLTLGAGFDIQLGDNIYLSPNLDWLFQAIELDNGATQNANIGLLTLGLIWH